MENKPASLLVMLGKALVLFPYLIMVERWLDMILTCSEALCSDTAQYEISIQSISLSLIYIWKVFDCKFFTFSNARFAESLTTWNWLSTWN